MLCKIAHFYWGGTPLSYLRFLTVKSFMLHNPGWQVMMHTPKQPCKVEASWVSHSHKLHYVGRDYLPDILNLGARLKIFNFRAAGFRCDIHEAYKSDFLRWFLLYHVGGFWSDMDVIFHKPITEKLFETFDWVITADLNPTVYYIAYIYSNRHCQIPGIIMRAARSGSHFDPLNYQCLGNVLVKKCFPDAMSYHRQCPQFKAKIINPVVNLPIKRIRDIGAIFENTEPLNLDGSVGLHWFGGHPMATKWENLLSPEAIRMCPNNLCKLIRSIGL